MAARKVNNNNADIITQINLKITTTIIKVDFPQLARRMMANKPSLKAAIRILKHERDQKGGSFLKLWSFAVKTTGLWEAMRLPNDKMWEPCRLDERYSCFLALQLNISNFLKRIHFYKANCMILDKKGYIISNYCHNFS